MDGAVLLFPPHPEHTVSVIVWVLVHIGGMVQLRPLGLNCAVHSSCQDKTNARVHENGISFAEMGWLPALGLFDLFLGCKRRACDTGGVKRGLLMCGELAPWHMMGSNMRLQ